MRKAMRGGVGISAEERMWEGNPAGWSGFARKEEEVCCLEKLQGLVTYSSCSALCSPMWLDYMHPTGKSVELYNLGEKIQD